MSTATTIPAKYARPRVAGLVVRVMVRVVQHLYDSIDCHENILNRYVFARLVVMVARIICIHVRSRLFFVCHSFPECCKASAIYGFGVCISQEGMGVSQVPLCSSDCESLFVVPSVCARLRVDCGHR